MSSSRSTSLTALTDLDLSTPDGMRRTRSQFDVIYRKLDTAFQLSQRRNFPQMMGAVVKIMVQMSADATMKGWLLQRGKHVELSEELAVKP